MTLDVLEPFDDEMSPLLLNDLLTEKKKEWVQRLQAQPL